MIAKTEFIRDLYLLIINKLSIYKGNIDFHKLYYTANPAYFQVGFAVVHV